MACWNPGSNTRQSASLASKWKHMELMSIATIILEIGFGNRCVWWLTSASCNIETSWPRYRMPQPSCRVVDFEVTSLASWACEVEMLTSSWWLGVSTLDVVSKYHDHSWSIYSDRPMKIVLGEFSWATHLKNSECLLSESWIKPLLHWSMCMMNNHGQAKPYSLGKAKTNLSVELESREGRYIENSLEGREENYQRH